jgi:RNA-directed DNA polymerase
VISVVNQTLDELRVMQHPEKTFIGRISRGFDFLGYRISPGSLTIANKTSLNFVKRICRLYEQGASATRIVEYVRRWCRWVLAGVSTAFLGCDKHDCVVRRNPASPPYPSARE